MITSGIQVKGSGFVHTLDYLKAKHGPAAVEAIFAAMSPEAAQTARTALFMTLCPVEHVGEFLDAIKWVLGPDDPEINYKISLASAKQSFSRVYAIFFRLGKPGYIISKAAAVYEKMITQGRLVIVESQKDSVTLRLEGFAYKHPEWCNHRLRGWYQAPLELSGCTIKEAVHHTCVLRGDSNCQWRYRW
ncbi:MAG: hypothetical protein P1V51_00520 [Deltaproteobacteria bacterium]|nr:hypothetical protein [Deltaproteobacteria bacterium]